MWVAIILSIASAVFFILTGYWLSRNKDEVSSFLCALAVVLLGISAWLWHNTGHGVLLQQSNLKFDEIYTFSKPLGHIVELTEVNAEKINFRVYQLNDPIPDSAFCIRTRKLNGNITVTPLYTHP